MTDKPTKKDLIKELEERGIDYPKDAKYDDLHALLNPPAPEEGKPAAKPLPKRTTKKLVNGKKIVIPQMREIPLGITSFNQLVERVTACEVACGIKVIEEVEIDD